MSQSRLIDDLKATTINLSAIFLDPNNPRFVGADWTTVPDDRIDREAIQDEARNKLQSKFGVGKLRMNMEENGFLPIDRIVVREFEDEKYVVLEGNRRICAAKMIAEAAESGAEFPDDVLKSLESIDCLQYMGEDPDAAWVIQGLRHITGMVDWSSFNKAKLLVTQKEEQGLTLTDVGKRFGLTAHGAGQWLRGYYAFRQAKNKTDYVQEVDERIYPYCQELFSRSCIPLRERWLEWDEKNYEFQNSMAFNEFVGYFYPRPDSVDIRDGEQPQGSWDNRHLQRQDDIRQLSTLYRDHREDFEGFRREPDIEKWYASAMYKKQEADAKKKDDQAQEAVSQIEACARVLENLPLKLLISEQEREVLQARVARLDTALGVVKDQLEKFEKGNLER